MTPLIAADFSIALPPLWLLGAGAFLGLVGILLGWGVLRVVAPRLAAEAAASLGDGFAGPFGWLLLALSACAVAFTPMMPTAIGQIGRSLARMATTQSFQERVSVPALRCKWLTLIFW